MCHLGLEPFFLLFTICSAGTYFSLHRLDSLDGHIRQEAIPLKNRTIFLLLAGVIFIMFIGYGAFQQLGSKEPSIPVSDPEPIETPVQTTFHLFFPYDTGTDFTLKEVTALVTLEENESPLERLQELLKEPSNIQSSEQLVAVLGQDAQILSVEVLANQTIKVNVNHSFVTQMNAGASLEGTIIRAFIKSVASLYDAVGVQLLVDGGPYESGHYFFGTNDIIGIHDEL